MIIFILNLLNITLLNKSIDLVGRIRRGNAHHDGKLLHSWLSQSLNAFYAVAFYSSETRLSFFKLRKYLHIKINPKFVVKTKYGITKHTFLFSQKLNCRHALLLC